MASMRGQIRGRGGEAESLVRERLRAIVAAATPQAGWVPERVRGAGESEASLEPAASPSIDADRFVPDWGEVGTATEVEQPAEERSPRPLTSPGRHRRSITSDVRVRWDPGRPGALSLCVVAVLAALLSAGLTWWSRPQPSPAEQAGTGPLASASQPSSDGPGRSGGATGQPATPAVGDPGPVSEPDRLVVSVIGQVRQPGLVSLEPGARVADAISAVGGALPDADLSTVNLARPVVDGEQIAVGVPGSSLPGAADESGSGALVDLNTANQAELEELPGIGPVLAQRIIDFRADNGGFTAVEQLREISGIGPTVYEDIVDLVTV